MLDWSFLFFHGRPLFSDIYSEGFATGVAFRISGVIADPVAEPESDWRCDDDGEYDCLFGSHGCLVLCVRVTFYAVELFLYSARVQPLVCGSSLFNIQCLHRGIELLLEVGNLHRVLGIVPTHDHGFLPRFVSRSGL